MLSCHSLDRFSTATRYAIACALAIAAAALPAGAPADGAPFADTSQRLGYFEYGHAKLADLDGDGDLDAFVAGDHTYRSEVYLNDGAGNYTFHGQVLPSSDANGLALGDLDGDGDIDAVVVNDDTNDHLVLINDGLATFTTLTNIGRTRGRAVEVGDLDGDGDLDIFIATRADDEVWLNDGTASFLKSSQELGSGYSTDVALSDLDGDGDLDAVVSNLSDQPNEVYINDGSAFFQLQSEISTNTTYGVKLADVDRDGRIDLVAANRPNWEFLYGENRVYLNTGLSSPCLPASGAPVGEEDGQSHDVNLADIDLDGDLDAIFYDWTTCEVYTNDGVGTFTISALAPYSAQASHVRGATGDLDGDGDLDVFAAMANANSGCRVYRNDLIHRNAQLTFNGNIYATSSAPGGIEIGDIDRDGKPDVLCPMDGGDLNWFGNPLGDATSWTLRTVATAAVARQALLVDLDGDGDLDILPRLDSVVSLPWYENAGNGAAWTDRSIGAANDPIWVAPADLNKDGAPDVVYFSNTDNELAWYRNDNRDASSWTKITMWHMDMSHSRLAAADVNGDGDDDVIANMDNYEGTTATWAVWFDNTTANGTTFTLRGIGPIGGVTAFVPCDMDGDGDMDVVHAGDGSTGISWWRNNDGMGTDWTQVAISGGGSAYTCVAAEDVDGDGDIDVLTNQTSPMWWEALDDTGTSWTQHIEGGLATGSAYAAAADINGDGMTDLAMPDGNKVVWRRNSGGQVAALGDDIGPTTIPSGSEDAILAMTVRHRGRSGDSPVELARIDLTFQDDGDNPLNSAQVDALLESISVYRDTGSGLFEKTSDTLVETFSPVSLSPEGVYGMVFGDDDANLWTNWAERSTYFIAVKLKIDAISQSPNQFRVVQLLEDVTPFEDANADIPLRMEDTGSNSLSRLITAGDPPPATPTPTATVTPTVTPTPTQANTPTPTWSPTSAPPFLYFEPNQQIAITADERFYAAAYTLGDGSLVNYLDQSYDGTIDCTGIGHDEWVGVYIYNYNTTAWVEGLYYMRGGI